MENDIGNIAARAVGEHQLELAHYIDDNMPDGQGKTRVLTQLAGLTIDIGHLFQANGVKPFTQSTEGQALVTRSNEEVDKEIRDGREG